MAKAKQTRRMIAMALAAAVTVTAVPTEAFAASDYSKKVANLNKKTESYKDVVEKKLGRLTQVTEVTTEVTGTADAETGELGENGSIEITTEVTIKDADGNVVEGSFVKEGESTETTVTPDDGEGEQTPVTVPLTPGETTEGSVSETTTSGDLPEGEDDNEYDYTETTDTDRTVIAETSDTEVVITESEAQLESVKPEYNPTSTDELYSRVGNFGITDATVWNAVKAELARMKTDGEISDEEYSACIGGKNDTTDFVTSNGKNDPATFYEMMENDTMQKAFKKVLGDLLATEAADADYRYVGAGEYSSQYVSRLYVTYVKDEVTGEPIVDENGNYVIDEIYHGNQTTVITVSGVPVDGIDPEYLASLGDIGDAETLNKVPYTALTPEYIESLGGDLSGVYDQTTGSRAQQFMLMDKNGNYVFAHCIDLGTGAGMGKWYKIANLEDNTYYASEDAEDHVRSIVMNGYWGTTDEAKEDGTYETGSLSKVKQDLLAAINNGDISDTVTISYKQDGQIVTEDIKVTEDLLAGFTPGEALDVMQAAIWSYANGSSFAQDGQDGMVVGGAYYGDTAMGQSNYHAAVANDPAGMARMKLFYDWLVNLDTDEESTTVINEKTFGETSLTIGDKIESSADGHSDTYKASLSFKAEFEVGENDELYVNLTYKDLEGNDQLVRKQLGQAGAEATDDVIVPNADNSYTLVDLALTENEDFTFDLRLEGVQQLKQNAYVFVSENGVNDSQTFVGMAEGTNTVDISTSVTVKFDVDEDDVKEKVRKWRDEGRIRFGGGGEGDPEDPNPTPDPKKPEPGENIPDEDVPLTDLPEIGDSEEPTVEIGEEEVPLADAADIGEEEVPLAAAVPATGDSNHVTGFGAMALAALAGMFGLRRKENN